MEDPSILKTRFIERPARKLILLRSKEADNYFAYCEEVGCGQSGDSLAWDLLLDIREALDEPLGIWLPDSMRTPGTGLYAHGVEVPAAYDGPIPTGFDVLDLEPCTYLLFQGPPYSDSEFGQAISLCLDQIQAFDPRALGYQYAPQAAPRIQFKPQGQRGYMEMLPVAKM